MLRRFLDVDAFGFFFEQILHVTNFADRRLFTCIWNWTVRLCRASCCGFIIGTENLLPRLIAYYMLLDCTAGQATDRNCKILREKLAKFITLGLRFTHAHRTSIESWNQGSDLGNSGRPVAGNNHPCSATYLCEPENLGPRLPRLPRYFRYSHIFGHHWVEHFLRASLTATLRRS